MANFQNEKRTKLANRLLRIYLEALDINKYKLIAMKTIVWRCIIIHIHEAQSEFINIDLRFTNGTLNANTL